MAVCGGTGVPLALQRPAVREKPTSLPCTRGCPAAKGLRKHRLIWPCHTRLHPAVPFLQSPPRRKRAEAFCSGGEIKDNTRKFLLSPVRGRDAFCANGENGAQGWLTPSCSAGSLQSYSFHTLGAAPLAAVVHPSLGQLMFPCPVCFTLSTGTERIPVVLV